MRDHRKTVAASVGGVAAAFFGALCCAGPLVFAGVGSGAGLAGRFEPLRPLFGVLMLAAFAVAYRRAYGRPRDRSSNAGSAEARERDAVVGATCAAPTDRRRDRILLWSAAVLALVLWTFPSWSRLLV